MKTETKRTNIREFGENHRHEEYLLEKLVTENTEGLLNNHAISEPLKRQIITALQNEEDSRNYPNYSHGSKIEISEDPSTGATAIFDGGNFYTIERKMPGLTLKFRAKEFGNKRKFERARRIQSYLMALKENGLLRGPKINHTTYSNNGKTWSVEPFIEHDRLTDILRGKNDNEKAEILEGAILDSLEISRVATAYRDMKDKEGNFYLKKNYKPIDFIKNLPLVNRLFSGNYIFERQDITDQFLKGFALRTCPYLQQKVMKKGKIDKRKVKTNELLKELRNNFNQEFGTFYNKRNRHVVNMDNHTGNVLVDKDKEKTYCDFEFTYEDLLEDPIAELVLTSGIQDKNIIKKLVNKAFDEYKEDINVTKEQFYETFRRRLIEKTLTRATRFLDLSERFSGIDKRNLKEQANAFYSYGLQQMREAGIEKTLDSVQKFNSKYLKLETTNIKPCLEKTIASLVSNTTNPENIAISYKEPIKAWSARKFALKAGIATFLAITGIYILRNVNVKDTSFNSLQLAYHARGLVLEDAVNDSSFITGNWNQKDSKTVLHGVFETENDSAINSLFRYIPNDLAKLKKTPYEWAFGMINQRNEMDVDLLRALYYAGTLDLEENFKIKETHGPLFCSPDGNPYYKAYDLNTSRDILDAFVASAMIKDLTRVHKGNLAQVVASYIAGLDNMRQAEIQTKSTKYSEFKKALSPEYQKSIDVTLITYLALKGVVKPQEIKSDYNDVGTIARK
jgi:hypothetical protein